MKYVAVTRAQLAAAHAMLTAAEQIDWNAWDDFRAAVLATPLDDAPRAADTLADELLQQQKEKQP